MNFYSKYEQEYILQKTKKKNTAKRKERKKSFTQQEVHLLVATLRDPTESTEARQHERGHGNWKSQAPSRTSSDISVRRGANDDSYFTVSGPVPPNVSNATCWKKWFTAKSRY
ncbi:Hypothetical predicted protein [Octopus vulgaris]|uniref:Uncharacterized protein n=1 Tax=Octopus vulgaris TaxID=6645 RepID=A0AA36BIB4_OCTVU|nr:Hypothetical predicted protein [Octopus vulgaris]